MEATNKINGNSTSSSDDKSDVVLEVLALFEDLDPVKKCEQKTQSMKWIVPEEGDYASALEIISDLLGEINKTVYLGGLNHNPKWDMEITDDLKRLGSVVEVICDEVC